MEKTEQPTSKKIEDARKKGDVFSSNDIIILSSITFGCFILISMLSNIINAVIDSFMIVFHIIPYTDMDFNVRYYYLIRQLAIIPIGISFGFVIIMGMISTISKLVQVGILFTPSSVKMNLNNINPASYVKKIFAFKNLFEFLKSIVKVLLITCIAFFIIYDAIIAMINAINTNIEYIVHLFSQYIIYIVLGCLMPFLVIAFADYIIQKRAYIKKLMMSMYEIKKEFKESEGNQEFKSARKSFFHEIMNSPASTKGVIINPTHFAVMFDYNPKIHSAPVIVAKGIGDDAKMIIDNAKELSIPIFRYPALARAVYSKLHVSEKITDEFIDAFAKIVTIINNNLYNISIYNDINDDLEIFNRNI